MTGPFSAGTLKQGCLESGPRPRVFDVLSYHLVSWCIGALAPPCNAYSHTAVTLSMTRRSPTLLLNDNAVVIIKPLLSLIYKKKKIKI